MDQSNSTITIFVRIYRAYTRLRLFQQFIIFLLVSLPFLWGSVGVGLFKIRAVAENESYRNVANVSLVYAEEVDATVGLIDLSLMGLRAHWVRNNQDFSAILANFNGLIKDKLVLQIAITDARGMLVFSSLNQAASALDLSDREHIRVHLDDHRDKLFISKAVFGRVSKKWSVQFTRPVYTANGQFDGVIVASVAPAYLSRLFHQLDLGEGATIELARADGSILALARRASNDLKAESMLTGPAFNGPKGTTDGRYRSASKIDGVERLLVWRRLPRYGLVIIVGQSVDDAYGAYSSQRNSYLYAGVAGPILLALLGWSALRAARIRRQTASALASAEALWKFALQGARDGVWDWDFGSQSATLSKRAMEILQVDSEILSCTAKAMHSNVHPDDVQRVRQALHSYLTGKISTYAVEHRVRARDGGWIWILSRGMVVESAINGKPVRMVGTFSDISDRKIEEETVAHQSQHDWLTGLPNRFLLANRLQQALVQARQKGTKLAVIYFDLDKFKPINDTYGHEVGDNLLKAVALRLRKYLRSNDMIARVGGDEFVVLLSRVSRESDSVEVASDILALLNTTFDVDGLELRISGSIGIANYPIDGEDEISLLRCADRAMYQAKVGGHNQIKIYQQ